MWSLSQNLFPCNVLLGQICEIYSPQKSAIVEQNPLYQIRFDVPMYLTILLNELSWSIGIKAYYQWPAIGGCSASGAISVTSGAGHAIFVIFIMLAILYMYALRNELILGTYVRNVWFQVLQLCCKFVTHLSQRVFVCLDSCHLWVLNMLAKKQSNTIFAHTVYTRHEMGC